MLARDILAEQMSEYSRALAQDIAREAADAEREEARLIAEAEYVAQLKEDEETRLSPRSMRVKRLAYFEPEAASADAPPVLLEPGRCVAITRKGGRCKKNGRPGKSGQVYCFIHE